MWISGTGGVRLVLSLAQQALGFSLSIQITFRARLFFARGGVSYTFSLLYTKHKTSRHVVSYFLPLRH